MYAITLLPVLATLTLAVEQYNVPATVLLNTSPIQARGRRSGRKSQGATSSISAQNDALTSNGPPVPPFNPTVFAAVKVIMETVDKERSLQVRAIAVQSRETSMEEIHEPGPQGNCRVVPKGVVNAADASLVTIKAASRDNAHSIVIDNEGYRWPHFAAPFANEEALEYPAKDILSDPIIKQNPFLDCSWANYYLQSSAFRGPWMNCELAYVNTKRRLRTTNGDSKRRLTGDLVFRFEKWRNVNGQEMWIDEIVVFPDQSVYRLESPRKEPTIEKSNEDAAAFARAGLICEVRQALRQKVTKIREEAHRQLHSAATI